MSSKESPAAEAPKLPAGIMRSADVKNEAFARVLLLGPMKTGKTTSLLTTAPRPPLLINCDCDGASNFAAAEGADFLQFDCFNVNGVGAKQRWTAARRACKDAVEAGHTNIIIVDTVSLLADHLVEDLSLTLQGFDLWNALYAEVVGGYKKLSSLPAHIFLVGHMDPREDAVSGIMPLLPGKAQAIIPALIADWVLFNYEESRTPQRAFVLGPQDKWTHSGRNIKRSCVIPADMRELFKELGVKP